jgi:hypothetical protein
VSPYIIFQMYICCGTYIFTYVCVLHFFLIADILLLLVFFLFWAGTTKGTGGDIIILEEAAYVDQNFFYETVAPLLLVGVTSLICISTLTSEIK